MTKTKEVTTAEKPKMLVMIESKLPEFAKALPNKIGADRFLRVALTSIQQNPKLLECTPNSMINALLESAQLGLMPDGILGHGYLVPYGKTVQFQPGYKGLMALAYRSGQIKSITANVVYKGDNFKYAMGLNDVLEHIPADDIDRSADKITHAWACAKFKDGGHSFTVLSIGEINAVRDKTQAYKAAIKHKTTDTPWIQFKASMSMKTAIKALSKFMPMATEFQFYSAQDDLREFGVNDIPDIASKTADKAANLTDRLAKEKEKDVTDVDPETGEILGEDEFVDEEADSMSLYEAENSENE